MKILLDVKTLSAADTISKAKEILNIIPEGNNLIFLNGEIGSGKTTLVKGIGKQLNITDTITSPTYGYKKEYPGLVHYDLYLTKKMKGKEINSLISEDLEDNLVIIEWGDKLPKIPNSIIIDIKVIDESTRRLVVKQIE